MSLNVGKTSSEQLNQSHPRQQQEDVNIVAIVAIVLRRMKSLLSSTIEPRRIK
jgi:hypothetical protein